MEDRPGGTTTPSRRRKAFAAGIAILAAAYLVLVIAGIIKPGNRLAIADFGVLVVAVIAIGAALRPDYLERLQKIDFAGLKLELGEVRRNQIEVQERQREQLAILEDVRLALRLLIGKNEREHLLNLFKHTTDHYQASGPLRDEIRRLRAMRLIGMCKGKTVGGMPDKAAFDLAEYVELTEDGLKFVSRLASQMDPVEKV